MNSTLSKLGVNRIVGNGCKCSSLQLTYSYSLPYGLDIGIVEYLAHFGKSSTSFEKQAILKIETQDFSITGIRRLKQIKFVLKNGNVSHLIDQFENSIVQWLEKRNE
ncbi:MAG: hypothetical protein WC516_05440 [Patescibacteria group bacterium]|jgi:hypothetical protein